MSKVVLYTALIVVLNSSFLIPPGSVHLRTSVSEGWESWYFEDGKIKTYSSNSWGNWEYSINGESGSIKTYTSADWDHWQVDGGQLFIRTYTSNDWDFWEIKGKKLNIKVQTNTSDDFDFWTLSGDVGGQIQTTTSEDWDSWQVSADLSSLPSQVQAAVLFIPVFTSSINVQGRIE